MGSSSSRKQRCCAATSAWTFSAIADRTRAGVEPVGSRAGVARPDAPLQLRHPDHEELVQVRAEDGQELHPLEKRDRGVLGLLEHPAVELEPGELAVDERVGRKWRWHGGSFFGPLPGVKSRAHYEPPRGPEARILTGFQPVGERRRRATSCSRTPSRTPRVQITRCRYPPAIMTSSITIAPASTMSERSALSPRIFRRAREDSASSRSRIAVDVGLAQHEAVPVLALARVRAEVDAGQRPHRAAEADQDLAPVRGGERGVEPGADLRPQHPQFLRAWAGRGGGTAGWSAPRRAGGSRWRSRAGAGCGSAAGSSRPGRAPCP